MNDKSIEEALQSSYDWSVRSFGEGHRQHGVINHILDELKEIEAEETGSIQQLKEWCDVLILAFNGAVRSGHTVKEVLDALREKIEFNLNRIKYKKYNDDGTVEHLTIWAS